MSGNKGRKEIDKAVGGLLKYLDREPWNELFKEFYDALIAEAAELLDLSDEELSEIVGESGYQGMLFGVVFEEFATLPGEEGEMSLIHEYLKRRGWKERPRGRRYLEQLGGSRLGLWEVVGVKPGAWIEVRPYGTGNKPLRVFEKTGSQSIVKWDCLLARPLKVFDRWIFSGGMLRLPRERAEEIEEMLAALEVEAREILGEAADKEEGLFRVREGTSDEEKQQMLDELAIFTVARNSFAVMVQVWLGALVRGLKGTLPQLVNRDGGELLFATARIPVPAGQRQAVIERLNAAEDLGFNGEEGKESWAWLVEGGDPESPGGAPTLGHVELKEKAVVLSANSRERGERGAARLRELLGDLAGEPVISYQSAQKLLEEQRERGAEGVEAQKEPALPPEEQKEIIDRYLDDHYRKTLDQPLAILEEHTPGSAPPIPNCARWPSPG